MAEPIFVERTAVNAKKGRIICEFPHKAIMDLTFFDQQTKTECPLPDINETVNRSGQRLPVPQSQSNS